jgi:CDP-6-deoxy-D-xylo-4-hexulose-3-dehydrase
MCKEINKRAQEEPFINADKVMRDGVLLPLHHGLTEEMFNRLHATIDEFIMNLKK